VDVTELLSRLSGVRQSGQDRWSAKCPSHEDRSPSLSVRALGDGRILLHCFGGCGTDDVLGAIGLEFGALFPPKALGDLPRVSMPFSPMDALRALTFESSVVAICAADLAEGKSISAADAERVTRAAGRIATALEVVHGG
jgi:hypothetical protein